MDEKDNSRSSLQTAADLGRAAKAAYRIAQAAAVSGVHGAAAAAVKETVPALVKFLLVVLLIMIVIPMVVFTALPNIFFGYDSSDTASVIHMTEQAMRIGGAYMSLDDFERTQIDSIVTGIAAEYEADGTAIDHIEVKNTMKEDDLLWIIAINSAAYEQDLDAMSAELIQNFCQSTLSYQPSLSLLGGSTSATLEVEIKRIDPEELMEQMGFNEDARQWAGTLFETLKDSGALEKYGGYFSAYQPDYSGDGSYSGDIQHGTSYDNDIDISRFVSPSTKNNLDLAAYAVQAWENNWGYVWGTYGNNRAQASRRQASRSQRRFFAAREDLHAVGSRITCRMLAVGPRRCLVDCYGYDLDMTQREIRYAAIPDLRTEFHPGSEIDCIVKEYHPRTGELIVSAKETEVNPFFGAEERHPVGSRRFAMISGKYGGGVFCNLPDGVTCMCNYSYQHEDADFMVGEHVMLMVQRYDQEKLQMYGKIMSKW